MLAENSGHEDQDRALVAVAFADVVNFSAMMAADEQTTFQAVHSLLYDAIAPIVATHRGTVVKWTGDGLLARFGSVLDAVQWGEAAQRAAAESKPAAGGSPVQLRVAINLGDVITTGGDIFGDGVNVAARLLEHAPPGGVALSESVHDAVRGVIADRVADLGLRTLKSFSRPARVFLLSPVGEVRRQVVGDASVPSVAVLPLENLGGNPADDYFADGVVEDIIVSLAGLGELLVVSRASTLAFTGRRVDPRDVGRALGVLYVVTGSVRRSECSIRVGMQLCEAATGRAVWSETAEASPDELFAMQDRVVGKIVAGIAPNIRASELRRALRKQPESFTAYDHTLRAMHLIHVLDEQAMLDASKSLRLALAEDEHFAMPHAWLAWWYLMKIGQGRSDDLADDGALAARHARRAIELDANNALALSIYGHLRSYLFHQPEVALIYLERARNASPSSSVAWVASAASTSYLGQGELAVQFAERGLRLSPLDRWLFYTHSTLCLAHYAKGTFEEAAHWGRLAFEGNPYFSANYRLLIGSLVALGQIEEARAMASRLLTLEPGFSVAQWEATRQPFKDKAFGRVYADRLRAASLPE